MEKNIAQFNQLEEFVKSNLLDHQYLDLDFKFVCESEDEINQLSDALAGCTNLVDLKIFLRQNSIEKQRLTTLFSALIKCKNLTTLNVNLDFQIVEQSLNQTSANEQNSLNFELSKITNLASLTVDFRNLKIGDEGLCKLGLILSECKNLKCLKMYVEQNSFSSEFIASSLKSLQNCILLDNLTLYLNLEKSSEQDAFKIGKVIGDYLNIKFFEIWYDGKENLQNLLDGLSSNNSLLSLSIWLYSNEDDQDKDEYIQKIYSQLKKYKRLNSIQILFYNEEDKIIKDLFLKLLKLKRLINLGQELV
ncbi:hypothetical protein ABPG74_006925 [Tetrahymena malaccensis]